MNIALLTPDFTVRRLSPEDADMILALASGNKLFYEYHPPFASRESILEDMNSLPPGKELKDKYYIGFFDGGNLVAIMDLILSYPGEQTAYIGLFMVEQDYQGKGVGSKIIQDCADHLATIGYEKIRLAIDKGNPQSEAFWTKNRFVKTGEEYPNDFSAYLPMERKLLPGK